jgi:hypothetical protein
MNLKISIMEYQSSNREWLMAEIESELGNPIDLDAWSTSELQHMYDILVGSMYNGIMWNRC